LAETKTRDTTLLEKRYDEAPKTSNDVNIQKRHNGRDTYSSPCKTIHGGEYRLLMVLDKRAGASWTVARRLFIMDDFIGK
jgi:hypothetical protein